jgi:hypothetical protein
MAVEIIAFNHAIEMLKIGLFLPLQTMILSRIYQGVLHIPY